MDLATAIAHLILHDWEPAYNLDTQQRVLWNARTRQMAYPRAGVYDYDTLIQGWSLSTPSVSRCIGWDDLNRTFIIATAQLTLGETSCTELPKN